MKKHFNYDHILAESFSGNLTEKEKAALDEWIKSSSENRQIYMNAEKVWKSLDLFQEMKRCNTTRALDKFHLKRLLVLFEPLNCPPARIRTIFYK